MNYTFSGLAPKLEEFINYYCQTKDHNYHLPQGLQYDEKNTTGDRGRNKGPNLSINIVGCCWKHCNLFGPKDFYPNLSAFQPFIILLFQLLSIQFAMPAERDLHLVDDVIICLFRAEINCDCCVHAMPKFRSYSRVISNVVSNYVVSAEMAKKRRDFFVGFLL